jgi:phosphate-selective porin OprO/OprP
VRGTYDAAGFTGQNGDLDTNDTAAGTTYNDNPSFWGGYAEVGYFITGETRGYKAGRFDRTKVLHPFNDGGWGAFQINGRVDYLDLSDRVAGTTSLASADYVNGGRQTAYQLSAIWNPTDYVRFIAQYSHINVKGGPRNGVSDETTKPINERQFDSDVFTMRAQLDF